MQAKRIIGVFLLAFAAASVVVLAVKEHGRRPVSVLEATPTAKTGPPTAGRSGAPGMHHVVAYYFHGNFRCASCNTIERWSKETIESSFAGEIDRGLLEFRAVNVEEPGNEHYPKDYQLYAQSLVLVEYVNGKQTRWTNLKRVWELVKDESQFRTYVRTGVKRFLEGKGS